MAEAQYKDKSFASSYNVGPNDSDCWTTGELVQLFCDKWNSAVEAGESELNKASIDSEGLFGCVWGIEDIYVVALMRSTI